MRIRIRAPTMSGREPDCRDTSTRQQYKAAKIYTMLGQQVLLLRILDNKCNKNTRRPASPRGPRAPTAPRTDRHPIKNRCTFSPTQLRELHGDGHPCSDRIRQAEPRGQRASPRSPYKTARVHLESQRALECVELAGGLWRRRPCTRGARIGMLPGRTVAAVGDRSATTALPM